MIKEVVIIIIIVWSCMIIDHKINDFVAAATDSKIGRILK